MKEEEREKEVLRQALVSMMLEKHDRLCTVLYRLPGQGSAELLLSDKEPQTFAAIPDAVRGGGFFIAPFAPSAATPCVFIRPETTMSLPVLLPPQSLSKEPEADTFPPADAAYTEAFARMHQLLSEGQVEKVVLARSEVVGCRSDFPLLLRFMLLCQSHPDSYVAYYNTPHTGAWLTVTPEVLLQQEEGAWRTMALAGTMPLQETALRVGDFGTKNRREQRLVADYIVKQLQPLAKDVRTGRTMVKQAGGVAHLCSSIRFRSSAHALQLLQVLHPTPAVCGLPLGAAREAIAAFEAAPRRYYAGFSGPLGYRDTTTFYVTLRCAELQQDNTAILYAGGGLLRESRLEDEWQETCRKMQTMQRALHG